MSHHRVVRPSGRVHHARMEQIPIGGEGAVVEPDQRGRALPVPFSAPPDREHGEGADPVEEPALPAVREGAGLDEPASAERAQTELDEVLEQGVSAALGMASVVATAISSALQRTMPGEAGSSPATGAALAGATLGLGIETARLAARGVSSVAGSLAPVLSFAWNAPSLRERAAPVTRTIDRLNGLWAGARPEHEAAATAFVADLLPRIVDGIVEQLDLTTLVAERIDLDSVVDRIDLDAIVDRIDVDEIVRRVDLDVAVGRVDLLGITDRLIGEVDLPELIRESTGAVTSETVRSVRLLSAEVDRRIAYVVDRVLLRRRERTTEASEDTDP